MKNLCGICKRLTVSLAVAHRCMNWMHTINISDTHLRRAFAMSANVPPPPFHRSVSLSRSFGVYAFRFKLNQEHFLQNYLRQINEKSHQRENNKIKSWFLCHDNDDSSLECREYWIFIWRWMRTENSFPRIGWFKESVRLECEKRFGIDVKERWQKYTIHSTEYYIHNMYDKEITI